VETNGQSTLPTLVYERPRKEIHVRVADIMNRRPVIVAPDTILRDVFQLMLRFHLNDVLVADGDALLGIITYKDIFRRLLPDYSEVTEEATRWTDPDAIEDRLLVIAKLPARDVMTTRVHTVTPDASAIHAGSMMNARQVKQLPVVEDAKLVGIVSYTDITWGLLSRYYKGSFYRR
jgi:CBS domain-containing protein